MSGFACMECGKKFRTVKAAMKAQDKGCSCGGFDIDLDVPVGAPVVADPADYRLAREIFSAAGGTAGRKDAI